MNKLLSLPVVVILVFVATTALQAQEMFDAIKNNDFIKVKALKEKSKIFIAGMLLLIFR